METSATSDGRAKRLLIVDGHAYAYRAFYAIRQLSSPTGAPTNATYGFVRILNKVRTTVQPSHVVVVWDGGLSSERVKLLPEYKIHRPEMPSALASQLDCISRFLKALGIAEYVRDGIEADDWIGTLSCRAVEEGFTVVIASSDKDFMQLVSPRVGILNPNDKTEKIWAPDDVRGKTGVEPEQIVDWLSLIGDNVDNIAGVPGVGPLRAAELLRQFGNIDELYKRLSEIRSERIHVALKAAEVEVRRNRVLIRLHCDLPDAINWPTMIPGQPDTSQLLALCDECGFKTMGKELRERAAAQANLF